MQKIGCSVVVEKDLMLLPVSNVATLITANKSAAAVPKVVPGLLYKHNLLYKIFAWFVCLLLLLNPAQAQAWLASSAKQPVSDPIVLQAQSFSFTPQLYYIADVLDERAEKAAVAWLLPTTAAGRAAEQQLKAVDLKGGAAGALRQFIWQSLPQKKQLKPLVLRLRNFELYEEALPDGRVEGHISLSLDFALQAEDTLMSLTEYSGGIRYTRAPDHHTVVEPALRKALANALQYLNDWMDTHAAQNPLLAKAVKVTFTDYIHNHSEDTLVYAPDRPLVWDDFKGKPRPGPYAASVMPTFAYDGPTVVQDGIIHLQLKLKVYALRENCWVRSHLKTDWGLNHEQRHVEIVRLVAERFKEKILASKLPVIDYGGIIAYEYIESFREMNKLQEQYDGETVNGTDHAAQLRWNARIDAELKAIGLK